MKTTFVFLTFLLLPWTQFSSAYTFEFGYCWGEQSQNKICSKILKKDSTFPQLCQQFAKEIGAQQYGYRFNKSMTLLEEISREHCDEMYQDNQEKGELFACYLEKLCPNGAPETERLWSIASAFSGQAVNKCIDKNKTYILFKFHEYSLQNCYSRVIVETL